MKLVDKFENDLKVIGFGTNNSRKSYKFYLKQIILLCCDNDENKFLEMVATREGYDCLLSKILQSTLNNKKKSDLKSGLNKYININGIKYDSDHEKVIKLLNDYANICNELIKYENILRTNNIVGEYAEYICEYYLKMVRVNANEKGYDAIKDGIKYQIKARWDHSSSSGSDQFGKIALDKDKMPKDFDSFVGIVFNKDLKVSQISILTKNDIVEVFRLRKTTASGKYVLTASSVAKYKYPVEFEDDIKKMMSEIGK